MKTSLFIGKIFIFFLIILLQACQSWQKEIKSTLKIEHVYNRPSDAYGPGMVVAYTHDSDYTRGCWSWNVLGIERNLYLKEISNEMKKPGFPSILKKSNIASMNIKNTADITFNIKLDAKDKGDLDAKYHSISEVRVILNNGSQWDAIPSISDMVKNIQKLDGEYNKDLQLIRSISKSTKFYLVLAAYSYDLEYQVKINNKWESTANLPQEVLKVVASKISIDVNTGRDMKIEGKQLFIGFNGLSQLIKHKEGTSTHSLIGPKLEGTYAIDISDLWDK